ncbi:SMP-30/gluconolactonase/LRE family protein [Streptomyces sp. NBC_00154]|uniref:SMP-30/gluconolactonase/LRE family protein n=1 Tax=Streptomyces sp. NBC_00154 TaxID=2975670 RepID=UPI002259B8EB|nr:SMP-30/gluconolactonase/LRE family protein [Streptomyces sp. NBC_00154]MCX5317017.1 SMP-30/gluconolactonase/LRE family protein [Streptomyces sp. NBC_00154]
MTVAPQISVAVAATARVGEGPVWDAAANRLHWVDILRGAIHTSDLTTGATTSLATPTLLGAAVPRLGGGLVAATAEGFAEVGSDGTFDTRCPILSPGLRMNDGKCDPQGRFWAGSTDMDFRPGAGALHVLGPDWSTRTALDGLTLPNGLGWSPDGTTFYLIDTIPAQVWAFAFDGATGALSERRLLRQFEAGVGLPDGMCVDADGRLWIAMWGGARVVCLSPDGKAVRSVEMPVAQPSSCAFAGPRLDRLAVTSAREGLDLTAQAPDGSVFVVDGLSVCGLPTRLFGS